MLDQTSVHSSLFKSLLLDTRQADPQPKEEGGSDFSFDPACLCTVAQEVIFYFHRRCQGTVTQPDETHCGRLAILVNQIKLHLPNNQSWGRTGASRADVSLPDYNILSREKLYTLLVDAVSEISNDYQQGYISQRVDNESYVQQAINLSPEGEKWLLTYRLSDHTFPVYGIRAGLVRELTDRLESMLQLE